MESTSGLVFEKKWKIRFRCHFRGKYRGNVLFTTVHKKLSKDFHQLAQKNENPAYKLKTCGTQRQCVFARKFLSGVFFPKLIPNFTGYLIMSTPLLKLPIGLEIL